MAGQVKLTIVYGKCYKDITKQYPYWAWEILTDDLGPAQNNLWGHPQRRVRWMPSYTELGIALKDVLKHELKIDKELNRKSEAQKWAKFFIQIMNDTISEGIMTKEDIIKLLRQDSSLNKYI